MVIDLMMPVITGYDVIKHVRQSGIRDLAIIVITAGDTAAIRRLDPSLVHTVLRKPFDIDVLGDLIIAAAQSMANERRARENNVLEFPPQGENVC